MTPPNTTTYKEILMSNNIASLPIVDMYKGISKEIVEQTSEVTQFNAEQREVLSHVRTLHGGVAYYLSMVHQRQGNPGY